VYVKSLDDNSAKSLISILKEYISLSAKIVTDKWRGYAPLNKSYDIEQKLSNKGRNFKELHVVIMQLKSWLRAIPTYVSKWHVQSYFYEFCFIINRSQFKQSIFHKTIEGMGIAKPIYHKDIK
jgi:hypothetical protein